MRPLPLAFRHHLNHHSWWPAHSSLLLAVSGGVDSMALLDLIVHENVVNEHRWRIGVAHVNHQLRGKSAEADARFVEKWAKDRYLPFYLGVHNVKAVAKARKTSIETAAREVRYQFLGEIAVAEGYSMVLTAHHADDQIETFFLRVLRGTGTEGLAGIRPVTTLPGTEKVQLIRPLLPFRRQEILTYAKQRKLGFRSDATNAGLDAVRNRLRNRVIPYLKQWLGTGFEVTVPRLMTIAEADGECLEAAARVWIEDSGGVDFEALPVALQRQVVRIQCEGLGCSLGFEGVESLRSQVGVGWNVGVGKTFKRDAQGRVDWVVTRSRKESGPTSGGAMRKGVHLDLASLLKGRKAGVGDAMGMKWRCQVIPRSAMPPWKDKPARTEYMDAEVMKSLGKVRLRGWKAGDRFRGLGMKQPSKVQDWFVNEKVPREERGKRILMVAKKGEVVWVEGIRVGERFKVSSQTRWVMVWETLRESNS